MLKKDKSRAHTEPVFPQSLFPAFSYQRPKDFLSQNLYLSYLTATNGATHHEKVVSGIMTCFEFLIVSFSKLKTKP